MHSEGDVVPISQLESPVSGRISRLLRTVRSLVAQPSVKPPGEILENNLVIVPLLKVRLISSCFVYEMVFFFVLKLSFDRWLLSLCIAVSLMCGKELSVC